MPVKAERATRTAKIHIYKVEVNGEIKLVRASSRSKAIKYAAKPIEAVIPSADELVDLVKQGVEVEDVDA